MVLSAVVGGYAKLLAFSNYAFLGAVIAGAEGGNSAVNALAACARGAGTVKW